MLSSRLFRHAVIFTALLGVGSASAQMSDADIDAKVTALRISGSVTGGTIPTSSPLFADMVSKIKAGKSEEAALAAAKSQYFASYLARRLALQMQNPALDASGGKDNDATAFLIAHFAGAGNGAVQPSLSTIWSENATYKVNVVQNGVASQISASQLTPAQRLMVDWSKDLVRIDGQKVRSPINLTDDPDAVLTYSEATLPLKHVGGYTTLSSKGEGEGSFAESGGKAGTNLRYIEGIWTIATGLDFMDVASTDASFTVVPRFIPQNDKNFEIGHGQPACLSCHGGGFPSLNHGYSTVADTFNFDPSVGLVYFDRNVISHRKSLGSDPKKRAGAASCNFATTPDVVCAPASVGAYPDQAWNLSETWSRTGVLDAMGWNKSAPTSGKGLNQLGTAIGQARSVYERMTKRVFNEVCPLGTLRQSELQSIVDAVYPYGSSTTTPTAGMDDIRTIVAKVAIHSSCL